MMGYSVPVIPYSSTNFPQNLGPEFQGSNDLVCSWPELLWSAITVGKANRFDLVRFGRYSYFEIVFRACIVYANLIERLGGEISRSSVYDFADPSEKRGISYFLGLMSAKLMAERFLGTPFLMHLDVYRDRIQPIFGNSRLRPDLVGMNDQGRWIVVEAKGRSGSIDSETMVKAKRQTRNLGSIGGQVPDLGIALGCHFGRGLFEIVWEDPADFDEEPPDIPIFPEEFISDYYKPVLELFREQERLARWTPVGDEKFLDLEIKEADLVIGINSRLLGATMRLEDYLELIRHMAKLKKHEDSAALTLGNDGISIRVGDAWQDQKMRRDPGTG